MTTAIVPTTLEDTMTLGKVLAQSGFFADSREAAQAVVKVLAGQELGFGPIASMTGVYIVKGKVALSANLMAAAIKRSGRYNYRVKVHDESRCEIAFFEQGEHVGTSVFTMDDAKRANLTDGNWRTYPRNMLFARALSNGVKWFCPDLSGGPLYTPDELGAKIDGESGEAITTTAIVVEPVSKSTPAPTLAEPIFARPVPPDQLPEFVRHLATKGQIELTATKKGALVGTLNDIFGGEAGRHAFLSETFGVASLNDCNPGQLYALRTWVDIAKAGDVWLPSQDAMTEAKEWLAALVDASPDVQLAAAAAANPDSIHASD